MLITFFVSVLLICGLDQLTKLLAVANIAYRTEVTVIENVFGLTLIHNDGAGWSVFAGHPYLLGIISAAVAALVVAYVVVKRPKRKVLFWALAFITGGALGNVIDRFRLGYVIDFLKIDLFSFPIFNVADCFVTVGAVLLVIYVLFLSDKKEQPHGTETL